MGFSTGINPIDLKINKQRIIKTLITLFQEWNDIRLILHSGGVYLTGRSMNRSPNRVLGLFLNFHSYFSCQLKKVITTNSLKPPII